MILFKLKLEKKRIFQEWLRRYANKATNKLKLVSKRNVNFGWCAKVKNDEFYALWMMDWAERLAAEEKLFLLCVKYSTTNSHGNEEKPFVSCIKCDVVEVKKRYFIWSDVHMQPVCSQLKTQEKKTQNIYRCFYFNRNVWRYINIYQ